MSHSITKVYENAQVCSPEQWKLTHTSTLKQKTNMSMFEVFARRMIAAGLMCCWLGSYVCNIAAAGQLAFNTYDGETPGGGIFSGPGEYVAQQFMLANNDTVTSALIGLGGSGSPNGTIEVSIWNDDGNGRPAEQLGVLGVVDVATVNTGGVGGDHLVNNAVSGLTPNEPHYLVLEWSDEHTQWVNAVWGGLQLTSRREITNHSAEEAMIFDGVSGDWTLQSDLGGPPDGPPFPVYQLASIKASNSASPLLFCDFNSDGECNLGDLDRRTLYGVDLEAGSDDAADVFLYDLTDDQVVDVDDLNTWLFNAASHNGRSSPYLAGDTNLDGTVDFEDFLTLSSNFTKIRRDWSDGDFNGDREVKFDDFLALSANFGMGASSQAAAVPEPSGACLAVSAFLGLIGLRRRR